MSNENDDEWEASGGTEQVAGIAPDGQPIPRSNEARPTSSHCGRDPSTIGCCGGTDETCSCECNGCLDPNEPPPRQRTQEAQSTKAVRDRELWEARKRGETVAELGMRYDLKREEVTQACVREQANEQRACDEHGCRLGVHEPPCPQSDPVELAICATEPRTDKPWITTVSTGSQTVRVLDEDADALTAMLREVREAGRKDGKIEADKLCARCDAEVMGACSETPLPEDLFNAARAEVYEACANIALDYAPGCLGGEPIAAAIRRRAAAMVPGLDEKAIAEESKR